MNYFSREDYLRDSNRKLDTEVENEIGKFLDKSLYKSNIFSEIERVSDINRQWKGIDIIISMEGFGLNHVNVDEKAQSSKKYIGKPRNTFALELSFINKIGNEQVGWFLDPKKETELYLFVWIEKVNSNINDKHYKLKEEDIDTISFCLVRRDSLLFLLENESFTIEKLHEKNDEIRRNKISGAYEIDKYEGMFFFYCTTKYVEQPINLVMAKPIIKGQSIIYGTVERDYKARVFHIYKYINAAV